MTYSAGDRLVLVTTSCAEYPVEVTGFDSLPCDLVVHWLGVRPLSAGEQSTVCLKDMREIRRMP